MKLLLLVIVYLIVDVEGYKGYRRKWKRRPVCELLNCEPGCKEGPVEGGCPKCVCAPKCPDLVCPKGCVMKEEMDGPCPGCDCEVAVEIEGKDDDDGADLDPRMDDWIFPEDTKEIPKPKCLPPVCPPGCVVAQEFGDPCLGCKCDVKIPDMIKPPPVQCSPPKCRIGCEVEKEYDGPCPGCKCGIIDEDELEPSIRCTPPKCRPGCEIAKKFDGPCPGCKCEKEEVPDIDIKGACDPVKCNRRCKTEIGPSGCPMCVCPPICDIPKCRPGCTIEQSPENLCPTCVCKEEIPEVLPPAKIDLDIKETCEPVKCDLPCKEGPGPLGCPTCICPTVCPSRTCRPGCVVEQFPGDPCPKCSCKEELPDIVPPVEVEDEKKDCEIPVCPWRCKMDKSGPCPKCICKKYRWG